MSRAFMRESDPPEPRCPAPRGCGATGETVTTTTLGAQLEPEVAKRLSTPAFWCPTPRCPVAYFDAWGTAVETSDLKTGAPWPKDGGGILCACFGIHTEDIEADAKCGRTDRIRELIARAVGPEARCALASASGRSCVPEARRLYYRAAGIGRDRG